MRHCLFLIGTLLMAMLVTSCLGEKFDVCPRPFTITVKALNADQVDITETGAVQQVIIFAFDETGQFVDMFELSSTQIKDRTPIDIKTEYPGHKSLTFVAWGNIDAKVDFSNVKTVRQKKDLFVKLKSHNGVAQSPGELFYGKLDMPIEYGGTEPGTPHVIEIRHKVASVIITAKNFHTNEEASDYRFELQESPNTYGPDGALSGEKVYYSPDITLGKDHRSLVTKIFNTFPTEGGKSYVLKVYKNNELLYTFDHGSDGAPFVPQLGRLLNIIIDIRVDLDVKVVVTPWGEVYQSVEY